MCPVKRPATDEEAALYDASVVPRWSARFGQLILRRIAPGLRAQVLDIGCGTGHPAFSLLERLDQGGRVIAIDRDQGVVDLARRRAMVVPGNRIFFKVESADDLKFGNDVFDVAVGNIVLGELEDPAKALSDLYRVLVPEGRVLMTQPLAGTFVEVLDMFREIANGSGDQALLGRVDTVAARYPTAETFAAPFEDAGFDDVKVVSEPFKMSFLNAAQLFQDDTIRFVGLSEWRWIAGFDPGGEALLDEVERRLDVYFGGGPLSLTVVAGLATGRVPLASD